MNRYKPTQAEIDGLKAKGWRVDSDGWWWALFGSPLYSYTGRTYREAVKAQNKHDAKKGKQVTA
jgi:hypothetical protein